MVFEPTFRPVSLVLFKVDVKFWWIVVLLGDKQTLRSIMTMMSPTIHHIDF